MNVESSRANSAHRAGTGSAHAVGVHVAQALAKLRQAGRARDPRILGDIALSDKALGKAHGFADAIEDRELPVAQLADDHVKTVGAEVDGRDDLG